MPQPTTLKRSLSLPLVVLYGLGTTIGAGIYALTGAVAATAGHLAPFAFILACVPAAFTALSFAEMCARYPRAGGEAVYVTEGLGTPRLGVFVGLLVVLAASVSCATLLNAVVGYLGALVHLPDPLVIVCVALVLGVVAAWGITESVTLAALFTLVEVGGIILVVVVARDGFATGHHWIEEIATSPAAAWNGVLAASLLAFYAFLGFEDMVNVAEEVRDAERILPRGIVITLIVTVLLYVALSLAAVLTVPPTELGASGAPLALVYERATGQPATVISVIAVFSILNGALIQLIMASRMLYGLARQGALPTALGALHPRTRTPVTATLGLAAGIGVLAIGFPLARLAETTSILTLCIFALVNLALWRVKGWLNGSGIPWAGWRVPRWLPMLGFVTSLGLVVYGIMRLLAAG